MAYTNENELKQALIAVRDRLAIKDKTEAQALVLSQTYPNCVYYTSDTHCIVIGGNIYGRGEQITANVFAYLPASEQDPSDPAFNDPTKIYIQPTSTAGVMKLWWYYNGTWINSDSQAMSVPIAAADITYDLTNTPDLGDGDVQSAIEAEDAKVEQLSLDTMGKWEDGEYWEELLYEKKGYSEISANNRRIGANHATTTDTSGVGRKIYIFPASEGDVFKVTGAAGSGDWTGFWKGGTAYSSITAANYLSSASVASGTYTAPADATLFAFVSIDARFTSDTAHVWKKTIRSTKTPADIQRQLIDGWTLSSITNSGVIGSKLSYFVAATGTYAKRIEVKKGQVLLLDLTHGSNYPLTFTDYDRVITELHPSPVYGAFEAPNDGYAYLLNGGSIPDNCYLYIMGYGGHAKDMVRIMEDTGEVADQKIDDEKVEFIKERFPYDTIASIYGAVSTQSDRAFSLANGVYSVTSHNNTSITFNWENVKIPKGTLIRWRYAYSSIEGWANIFCYSTSNPQDYYTSHSNSMVGFTGLISIFRENLSASKLNTDEYFIMPVDGYPCYWLYTKHNTLNEITCYDTSLHLDAKYNTYDDTNTQLGVNNVQSAIEAVDDRLTYRHKFKNLMEDESYSFPMEVTVTSASNHHTIKNLNSANFPLTAGKYYGFFARIEKLEEDTASVGSYRFISYRSGTSSTQITADTVWEAQAGVNHAVGTTVTFLRVYRAGETRSAGQYIKIIDQSSGTTSQTHHISIKRLWVIESDKLDDLVYFFRYYGYTDSQQSFTITNDIVKMSTAMISTGSLGYDVTRVLPDEETRNIDMIRYENSIKLYKQYNGALPSGASSERFMSDQTIGYFPPLDFTGITSTYRMFQSCIFLRCVPDLTYNNKSISAEGMFNGCHLLKYVGDLNGISITNADKIFQNCFTLRKVSKLVFGGSSATATNNMFYNCYMLERIEEMDITCGVPLCATSGSVYHWLRTAHPNLRYILIKGIGTASGQPDAGLSFKATAPVWGVNSDEHPDARQSLVDSLLTYSYDRATAGYSACTVTLSANTKALLTDEEIEQITAKGYTIA